jgi:hypothetical protein
MLIEAIVPDVPTDLANKIKLERFLAKRALAS